MELPTHPETDDAALEQERVPKPLNWASVVGVAVLVIVLVAMVILHLTGVVGPSAH